MSTKLFRPKLAEQPTSLPSLHVLVAEGAEPTIDETPKWRQLLSRLGRARRLQAAAVFAWRAKGHRQQRDHHELRDRYWTGRVRDRLDEAGVHGFTYRGAAHSVKVQMSTQTPRRVADPVALLTALGPWIVAPNLIQNVALDWDQLDQLCDGNPVLAEAVGRCIERAPERRRVLIDRLA